MKCPSERPRVHTWSWRRIHKNTYTTYPVGACGLKKYKTKRREVHLSTANRWKVTFYHDSDGAGFIFNATDVRWKVFVENDNFKWIGKDVTIPSPDWSESERAPDMTDLRPGMSESKCVPDMSHRHPVESEFERVPDMSYRHLVGSESERVPDVSHQHPVESEFKRVLGMSHLHPAKSKFERVPDMSHQYPAMSESGAVPIHSNRIGSRKWEIRTKDAFFKLNLRIGTAIAKDETCRTRWKWRN